MHTNTEYNNLSYVIDRYVPQHIKDNYPLFYDFIETYYEYLQQNDKFVSYNIVKNYQNWNDVDTTLDDFIDFFKKEYINLPFDKDWSLYIKHYKEIYSSKGSSKSLQFFIKLLTGLNTEIYYPNRYLMKSSDGVYRSYNVICCERIDGINYNEYISTKVLGRISEATGVIEKIDIFDNHIKVYLSSCKGNFVYEPVIFNNGTQFTSNTINNISKAIINKPGNNYKLDDTISILNYPNAKLKIESIYNGKLDRIDILEGGSGYQVGDRLELKCDNTEEYSSLPYVIVDEVIQPLYNYNNEIILNKPGYGYQINDELSYNDLVIKVTEVSYDDKGNYIGGIVDFDIINDISDLQYHDIVEFIGGNGDECSFTVISIPKELLNSNEIGKIKSVKILYKGYGLLEIPIVTNIITVNGSGASFETFSDYAGGIKEVSVIYPECNITEPIIVGISTTSGINADIDIDVNYQYKEVPYYYKNGSFLSNIFKLQDSYYWQEYSYVLNVVGSVINKYKEIFKEILHPAGFIFFTNTVLDNYISIVKGSRYVDSIIDTYLNNEIDKEGGQYIELLQYKDRIIHDEILYTHRNVKLTNIVNKKLDEFKKIGGKIVNSEIEIYTDE